jgi:UPF0755 protein
LKNIFKLILVAVITTALAISIHNAFLLNDYRSTSSDQKVQVLIESGDTGYTISKKLEESNVIKAAKVFYKIALNDRSARSIAPGVHEIDKQISICFRAIT